MADDKHYVPGDFYRICDRTGFKIRAGHTKKEWEGIIVREESWEPRQPQDFVKGVRDDQSVPEPRPRQTNVFTGPIVTLTTDNVNAGGFTIPVENSYGFSIGDSLWILLANGNTFLTTIIAVPDDGVTLQIADPLPYLLLSQVEVTDYGPSNSFDMGSELQQDGYVELREDGGVELRD